MSLLSAIGGLVGLAFGGPMGAALGSGIGTLASGGDIGDALKSGVMGYGIALHTHHASTFRRQTRHTRKRANPKDPNTPNLSLIHI